MKRLLLSVMLALAVHGFILSLNPQWTRKGVLRHTPPRPITLSMTAPKPVPESPPSPNESPASVTPSVPTERKDFLREIPGAPEPAPPVRRKIVSRPPVRPKAPPPESHRSETSPPREFQEPAPERFAAPEGRAPTTPVPPGAKGAPPAYREEIEDAPQRPLPVTEAVPVYMKNPPPEYPRIARRRGYEGTVVMEVLVGVDGGVKDIRPFRSSGYPVLDRAAEAALRQWLFEPGRRGDRAIEMWVRVPFRFELK